MPLNPSLVRIEAVNVSEKRHLICLSQVHRIASMSPGKWDPDDLLYGEFSMHTKYILESG